MIRTMSNLCTIPSNGARCSVGANAARAIGILAVCIAAFALHAGSAAAAPGDDEATQQSLEPEESASAPLDSRAASRQTLAASLTIFVVSVFLGFELITKVPPTLHTPLMSGSNAISGITLVGAVIVAGVGISVTSFVGLIAVILATINVVGGFLVTHRMLAMFRKR